MSHHASGPNFGFPRGDARLDITDFYAFTKPGDPAHSIMVLNVHPSFALNSPEPTTTEPFAPGALYEVQVDTDGDAAADLAYSVQFESSEDGGQTAIVRRRRGVRAAGMGEEGELIVQRAPVSVGREALVTRAGDHRFFCGWRSDPFFFDVKNVCSIAIELPNATLGGGKVGLWARTVDKTADGWVQADRGGRPMQAVFLPGDERLAYLSGQPADDERFIGTFAHELAHTGGYTAQEAIRVARTLLPDILPYEPCRPASFPHNGRTLTDDVVDVFLSVLTNGRVTGDKVGPHGDLRDEFPYLGPPHG